MGPARSCEGACAPPMRWCKASSSVRLCGCRRFRPGARGHLGALRAPVGTRRRFGGHRVAFPVESAGVWQVGGWRPGAETAEPEVVPPLAEGVPELQQAGADAAPVVPAERLLPDLLPPVVGDEVIPRRAGVPVGGGCHIHVAPGELVH